MLYKSRYQLGRQSEDRSGRRCHWPSPYPDDDALVADDLALDVDGTACIAGFNTLWKVAEDGHTIAALGGPNSTVIQGITSARFGRTIFDERVMYMTTQGGMLLEPPGSIVHGRQLLAVNIDSLR